MLFLFYFICKVLENERNRKKKSYVHFNQKNTKKKLSVSLWITSASQRKKEDTLNWNCVIASYRIKQNKQMLILHGDALRYL